MTLHDRETERELLRIAQSVAGAKGLERPDDKQWSRLASLTFLFALWMFATCMLMLADFPVTVEQAMCSLVMMLLIKHGRNDLWATAGDCGLFNVLVNLPITAKRALSHIRSRFIRSFWLPSLLFPIPLAVELHRHAAAAWPEIASGIILLTAICWATIILAESAWMTRLKLVAIWHVAAIAIIAYLAYLHYLGSGIADDSLAYNSSKDALDHALWIFPPAWIFPGKAESGGHFLAALWIAAGLWSWWKWRSTAFPAYDKPHDFVGAFGSFSYDESEPTDQAYPNADEGDEAPDEDDVIFEPPIAMPSGGWLDRFILRAIRPEDRAVAGAMDDPGQTWTRRANVALLLAPFWLIGSWFFREGIADGTDGILIPIVVWFLPLSVFFVTLFPYSSATPRALSPFPLGALHVPFHSMSPVTTRSLLRISQRICLVRCCLFGLVVTPFYHLMALFHGSPQIAAGVVALVPAAMVFWIFTTPILVCSKIRTSIRRKRGVFLLHYANGVVIISLSILAFLCGLGGVACAYFFAAEGSEEGGIYLLPAALGGLVLSAVFSRIVFEITHNELRHRRYYWMLKMT